MLNPISAGYTGKEQPNSYFGHISRGSFFCTVEVFDGYTQEQGDVFLGDLAASVDAKKPSTLRAFEDTLNEAIKKTDVPVDFSLAAGYAAGEVFYLKTIGTGKVYIYRRSHFEELIQGDSSASGYIEDKDMFIFTTAFFMETTKREAGIKKMLHPSSMPETVAFHLSEAPQHATEGGAALFVRFQHQEPVHHEETPVVPETPVMPAPRFAPPPSMQQAAPPATARPAFAKAPSWAGILGKLKENGKKKIALAGIVIVLLALLLNAGRLFGKKQQAVQEETLSSVKAQVEESLNGIDENGDIQNSLGVISASRQKVVDLKAKDKKLSEADIKELTAMIDDKETKILKREDRQASEFYDLALEEKDGRADRMYLDGDTAALLNPAGRIYLLSLENKSVKKDVYGEIANAQLAASWDKAVFFFRQGAGIYKIQGDDKPKRVIADDKEWGNIADMALYNGNIYLLDSKNDEIYKYLVAENGYSDKNSYVKSGKMSLSGANSLAIDSAVYVGMPDAIVKFLAGEKQDFTSQFPTTDVTVTRIYTNKDLDQLYALDKSAGVLYVFTKDGAYVKQVRAAAFKQADDFVVYKGSAFTLSKSKVFKTEL